MMRFPNRRSSTGQIAAAALFCVAIFFCCYFAEAHEEDEQAGLNMAGIRCDEMLGKKIDGNVFFLDEHGKKITPSGFIDMPTLVLPVYYSCPKTCGLLLGNLALALNDVPQVPGREYRVLTLSIDDEDDQASALQAKNNYFKLVKKNVPDSSWTFLTGDNESISNFADSLGFRFQKTGKHEFAHPNVLIALARDGTIIRYLYGPSFLPFDIGMALTEAAAGTPGISVRKLLSYCFNYDTERKAYTFRTIRLLVLGSLIILGVVFFFILRKRDS
jgi:protein SCO1